MPNLTLDEQYALWYESLRADGTLKHRTLAEMRQRFKPVRLYANSFTVRDSWSGQIFRIRFYEDVQQEPRSTTGATDGK
jgi:hypothetical protein